VELPVHLSAVRPILQRVIVVVMDGVRADAAPLFHLGTLDRLAARGAATFAARTVIPSVTAAAMGSLFTGVAPAIHGLDSDRFRVPRPRGPVDPLPAVLRDAGIASSAFLARLPLAYRPLAAHLAKGLGLTSVTFRGEDAAGVLRAASSVLTTGVRGLVVLHWPDADRAGHAHGWTSRAYAAALRRIDESLGALDRATGGGTDPATLLIAVADHGGGGVVATDHDSAHVHDRTIPMILTGGAVRTCDLGNGASLLDIPATVLWALGTRIPPTYAGRPLTEAFTFDATRLASLTGERTLAGAGVGDRAA